MAKNNKGKNTVKNLRVDPSKSGVQQKGHGNTPGIGSEVEEHGSGVDNASTQETEGGKGIFGWLKSLFSGKKDNSAVVPEGAELIMPEQLSLIRQKFDRQFEEMGKSFDAADSDLATLFDTLLSELVTVHGEACNLNETFELERKNCEEEISKLKGMFDTAIKERDDKDDQLRKVQQELQTANANIEAIKSTKGNTSDALVEASQRQEKAEKKLKDVENRLKEAEDKRNEIEEKYKKADKALKDATISLDASDRKCSGLKDEIQKLQAKLLKAEHSVSDVDVAGMKREIEDLKEKLCLAENDRDRANDELEETRKEVKAVEESKKELEAQLEATRTEVVERDSKLEKLGNTEAGKIQLELDEANSRIAELDKSVGTLTEEKQRLETERESILKDHKIALDAKDAEKKSEIEAKESEMAKALNDKDTKWESVVAEMKSEMTKALNDKEDEMKSALDAKSKEMDDAIKAKDTLIGEKDKDISKFKHDVENLKKEIDSQKTEIDSLNQNIINEKENVRAEKNRAAKFQERIDVLELEVEDLNSKIENRDEQIERLNEKLSKQDNEKKSVESELKASVCSTRDGIISSAKNLAALLEEGGYENGLGDIAESCGEDETLNSKQFSRILADLTAIDPARMKNTSEYLEACEKILISNLEQGMDGVLLPLARLCAYSRMPFMRDERGEDNMWLDRAKTSRIESALNSLLAQVGIELIAPVPFCDRLDEGEFEDGTGNVPNLDYICPNSRSHLDGVDRENVKNIVTDIITVGYRKGDKLIEKAVVLI